MLEHVGHDSHERLSMEMEPVVARLPEDCVLIGYDCIATTRLYRHDMLKIETCPEVAYAIWNVFVGDLLLLIDDGGTFSTFYVLRYFAGIQTSSL